MKHRCGLGPVDLGPFLLGGESVAEHQRIELLTAACPACAVDLLELRPVVAAMAGAAPGVDLAAAADPGAAPDLVPPGPLPALALDRMLAAVQAERPGSRSRPSGRTWQRPAVVAAATVVVAALVSGGLAVAGHRTGREVTLTGSTGARASARLVDRAWGTALRLEVRGLEPGTAYGAWLAYPDGKRLPAGTFMASADGSARVDLAAAIPLDRAARIGVTTLAGGDDVLVLQLS